MAIATALSIPLFANAQNVGIGTNTPSARLHIEVPSGFTSPVLQVNQQGSATPYLIVQPNGNVGISVASPSEALDVSGNVQFSGALMPGGNAGSAGFVLMSQGAGNAPVWVDTALLGDKWGGQVAQTQGPLIGDGTSANPIGLQSGTNAGDVLIWNGSQWAIKPSPFDSVCGTATANYVMKWTGSELCNSIIYDNGTRVGIGTNNPSVRLEVRDSQIFDVKIHVFNAHPNPPQGYNNSGQSGNAALELRSASPGGVQYIDFTPDALNKDFLGRISYNELGKDRMAFYTGGKFSMVIDSNGFVGIGTANPDYPLHVPFRQRFHTALIEGSVYIPTAIDSTRIVEGIRFMTGTPSDTFFLDVGVVTGPQFSSPTADTNYVWIIQSWPQPGGTGQGRPILLHTRGRESCIAVGAQNMLNNLSSRSLCNRPGGQDRLVIIDSGATDVGMTIYNAIDSAPTAFSAGSGNVSIELRTEDPEGVAYIDFVPGAVVGNTMRDFGARISYNEYIQDMLNIFVNHRRVVLINSSGNVGIYYAPATTSNPTNILTVQQGSPTDPIADSWTVYSTRETKAEVIGVVDPEDLSNYLKYFREIPVYKWRRTEGEQVRLSPMADDSNVPGEIRAYDEKGNVQGIDLYGYIGFLHAVMKGMYETIEQQNSVIAQQQEIIKQLEERVSILEKQAGVK